MGYREPASAGGGVHLYFRGHVVAELDEPTAHHPSWLAVGRLTTLEAPAAIADWVRRFVEVSAAYEANPDDAGALGALQEVGESPEIATPGLWTIGVETPGRALATPPGLIPLSDGWWEIWWQYADTDEPRGASSKPRPS